MLTYLATQTTNVQSKWYLTQYVLLSFISFAYVIAWLHMGAQTANSSFVRKLGFGLSYLTGHALFRAVGRNSIEVFATHIFWIYASVGVATHFDLNAWYRLLLFCVRICRNIPSYFHQRKPSNKSD